MIHIPFREDNSFAIVFFFALIVPLIFVPIFPESYETVKYPAAMLLMGVSTLILLSRKEIRFHKATLIALLVFGALNIISTFFSLDVPNSIIGFFGRYTGSLFFITTWILFIVSVWNAVQHNEQKRLAIIKVLFFDALAISVFGIFQSFGFGYYAGIVESARYIIPSFVGNQNFYAMFLVAVLPAVVMLWNQAQSKLAKYYFVISSAIIVWAIILSGSRGGLVGLGAAFAVFVGLVIYRKYSRQFLVGIMLAAALSAVLYFAFFATTRTDTVDGVSSNAQYTTQSRYMLWSKSWTIIQNNPVLGVGPTNFFIPFQMLGTTDQSNIERFDDAHNMVINMAVNIGIPAVLAFLVLIFIAVRNGWRETIAKDSVSLWALSGLAGLLAAAMFNPVSVAIWALLGIILGIMTSYTTIIRPIGARIRVVGYVLGVALMVVAVGFISSEVFTKYGYSAYLLKDNAKAQSLLKKSVFLNPLNATARTFLIGSEINLRTDLGKSAEDIESILRQHPYASQNFKKAADLYYRIYMASKEDRYKQRSLELYDRALVLEPDSAPMYASAGYAAYKMGESQKSLEFLDKQIEISGGKDYPYSLILKSKIHMDLNQKEEAVKALKTAQGFITDQPLLKNYIAEVEKSTDLRSLAFPFYLSDIDI